MPRTGACSGCCVRSLGCESCQRCVPRYADVEVTVTPGPYTDMTCCGEDGYGQFHFGFRLTYTCGQWVGSGTCGGLDQSLDITATLDGVGPDCTTAVSSSLMETPITFDGVLPAGMTGTAITDAGDELDWEILSADVVENPLIKERCSPCTCATCLPRRLCSTVTLFATAYEDAVLEAGILTFDCTLKRWSGTVAEHELNITIKSAEEGICGADVVVSGDRASLTDDLLFEGPLHSRKFHGTICSDSHDLESTLGVPELIPCDPPTPCDDPPPQEFVSLIDATYDLFDGEDIVGSLAVRELSAGDVCETCDEPPIPTNCCEFTPIPRTIHGTWNYGGCTPGCATVVTAFHYNPDSTFPPGACSDLAVWEATVSICGMGFTAYLTCCTSFGNAEWGMVVDNDSHVLCAGIHPVGGPYGGIRTSSSCDPLLIEFLWSWSGTCCPDGSDGAVMTCAVTL